LDICNGLRPEFGKGTPEFYKELSYRCMNANPNQRPTSEELKEIICFWYYSIKYYEYNRLIATSRYRLHDELNLTNDLFSDENRYVFTHRKGA
ncbi:3259_t:CDS:2, partial [Funneliformis geosporum]